MGAKGEDNVPLGCPNAEVMLAWSWGQQRAVGIDVASGDRSGMRGQLLGKAMPEPAEQQCHHLELSTKRLSSGQILKRTQTHTIFMFSTATTSPRARRLPNKGAKLNASIPLCQSIERLSIPILSFFQPKNMRNTSGPSCCGWVRFTQGIEVVQLLNTAAGHSLVKGWRGSGLNTKKKCFA